MHYIHLRETFRYRIRAASYIMLPQIGFAAWVYGSGHQRQGSEQYARTRKI